MKKKPKKTMSLCMLLVGQLGLGLLDECGKVEGLKLATVSRKELRQAK
jgi:hypothetical protein